MDVTESFFIRGPWCNPGPYTIINNFFPTGPPPAAARRRRPPARGTRRRSLPPPPLPMRRRGRCRWVRARLNGPGLKHFSGPPCIKPLFTIIIFYDFIYAAVVWGHVRRGARFPGQGINVNYIRVKDFRPVFRLSRNISVEKLKINSRIIITQCMRYLLRGFFFFFYMAKPKFTRKKQYRLKVYLWIHFWIIFAFVSMIKCNPIVHILNTV